MPDHFDAVVPAGDDPIDSADTTALRHEILRLRDIALGEVAQREVLTDRIAELERELHALGAANKHLQTELARSPLMRMISAIRRRLPGKGPE